MANVASGVGAGLSAFADAFGQILDKKTMRDADEEQRKLLVLQLMREDEKDRISREREDDAIERELERQEKLEAERDKEFAASEAHRKFVEDASSYEQREREAGRIRESKVPTRELDGQMVEPISFESAEKVKEFYPESIEQFTIPGVGYKASRILESPAQLSERLATERDEAAERRAAAQLRVSQGQLNLSTAAEVYRAGKDSIGPIPDPEASGELYGTVTRIGGGTFDPEAGVTTAAQSYFTWHPSIGGKPSGRDQWLADVQTWQESMNALHKRVSEIDPAYANALPSITKPTNVPDKIAPSDWSRELTRGEAWTLPTPTTEEGPWVPGRGITGEGGGLPLEGAIPTTSTDFRMFKSDRPQTVRDPVGRPMRVRENNRGELETPLVGEESTPTPTEAFQTAEPALQGILEEMQRGMQMKRGAPPDSGGDPRALGGSEVLEEPQKPDPFILDPMASAPGVTDSDEKLLEEISSKSNIPRDMLEQAKAGDIGGGAWIDFMKGTVDPNVQRLIDRYMRRVVRADFGPR